MITDHTAPRDMYDGIHVCEGCLNKHSVQHPELPLVLRVRRELYRLPVEDEPGFIGPLPATEAERAFIFAIDPARVSRLRRLSFTPWWPDGTKRVLSIDELRDHRARDEEHREQMAREFYWPSREMHESNWRCSPDRAMNRAERQEYADLFGYEICRVQRVEMALGGYRTEVIDL